MFNWNKYKLTSGAYDPLVLAPAEGLGGTLGPLPSGCHLHNVHKGRVQKKKNVKIWSLTITGGEGVSPNHTLIAKTPLFLEHYIHLQLYSFCSCT